MTVGEEPPPARSPALEQDEQRDEELVSFLERDQLSAGTSIPVPRVQWSRRARAWLWALRVAVLVLAAMVVYAFVAGLR